MNSTINFGIDLGTSNSLIAKFDRGDVVVFKNPTGFKETLPSVVGFRNDRVLVGDAARTFGERDSRNVVGRFKRKMGTSESFNIKSLDASKTPVDLSAIVLKELKSFVQTGEALDAAVITIPASFDTLQSNATKQAGLAAGFKTVVLLQEPIAASLAYANKERSVDLKNSRWLVYDLGGGTFDVALVKIVEGELTVMDHEGDNFLGGTDFDALIVEKLVLPEVKKRGRFEDLEGSLKSASGSRNLQWMVLTHMAEEAKVELSARTSAEVDLGARAINIEDDDGTVIDPILTITRSDFEAVIKDAVDSTIEMTKRILARNSLQPNDLGFILMVGGSTYIPYVRKRVGEVMGIPVSTTIDPTNAIAVGAAYYAGTKERVLSSAETETRTQATLKVKLAYNKTSQEPEETVLARFEGRVDGMQYRILSADGAYDSGLKFLQPRIQEDLPLREGAYNVFELKVFDAVGNPVTLDAGQIQIAQGRYSVAGQMLPDDICVVIDDHDASDTTLVIVFSRNSVLPAKMKMIREVGKTLIKGSTESLHIMVVEGASTRHSSTNQLLGHLEINGKQVSRDLIKGTDVELTFTMTESRELTVSAYLAGTVQEFSQVFTPKDRSVSTAMLAREMLDLETKLQDELEEAEDAGRREVAAGLTKTLAGVQALMGDITNLKEDDVTDQKYQLEAKKRQLASEMFDITAGKRLELARKEYHEAKADASKLVHESGNDRERAHLKEILGREHTFIGSNLPEKIAEEASSLRTLEWGVLMRTPDFLKGLLNHLAGQRASMNDQAQANRLFDSGKLAMLNDDWPEVRAICTRLWDLLPTKQQAASKSQWMTGLV